MSFFADELESARFAAQLRREVDEIAKVYVDDAHSPLDQPQPPLEESSGVVKRFRKQLSPVDLPLQAGCCLEPAQVSTEDFSSSIPRPEPVSLQSESPNSSRSWSLIQPQPSDAARALDFASSIEACQTVSPLQVASSLPAGARASAEKPVLRDAAAALPRPSFAVPKDTRSAPDSSLPGLPRPEYAPQAFYNRGPRHRLEETASPLTSSSLSPSVSSSACVPSSFKRPSSGPLQCFRAKPRTGDAATAGRPSFQTSANDEVQQWAKVRLLWAKVAHWLLALSPFLQELLVRPNHQDLLELLWKKNSANTVHRYLHSLLRVFVMLEDLQYDCSALSQLQLHDAVFSLHRSFSGALTFGDNILKALRWSTKCFQLSLPDLYSGMFGGNSLFAQTGEKREAPPLPLAFVVWLEAKLLAGIEDNAELMFVGATLSCIWSSLRFSDAQRVKWSSLLFDTLSLRGWSYRTKTHKRGTPFAAFASGFLFRDALQDWATSYFWFLNNVKQACVECFGADCDPDCLFFTFDEAEPFFAPLSYGQALLRLRALARLFSLDQLGGRTDWIEGISLHSMKATMLSFALQTSQGDAARAVQGHHKMGSIALYGRDDIIPALRLQRGIVDRFLSGWRATTPLQRGLVTLPEPPVMLSSALPVLSFDFAQVQWLLRYEPALQAEGIFGNERPAAEVDSSTCALGPLQGALPVAVPSADSAPTPSFAVPDPLQVSEGESDEDDLGTPDESQFVVAAAGKVLHINAALPGESPRPACGSFAKNWRILESPGSACVLCRHPACFKVALAA